MHLRFLGLLLVISLVPGVQSQAGDYLPRIWTNSVGIKREASFVKVEGNNVTLLLNNGQLVTMPLDRFSLADQDYVRSLQSKAANSPSSGGAGVNAAQPAEAQAGSPQSTPVHSRRKSILLRPALIHAPDPKVQPKAEIYVSFPELGKSRTDEPMGMRIRIPENYKPDRPVPLLVWLGGGDGTSHYDDAMQLVNPEDFVIVALTYPGSLPEPKITAMNGQMDRIWEVHEKMLAKLQDMIPNINPRLRVVAGFSNGAHVIGGCLAQQVEGLYDYFNVYILIEGGYSNSFNYPALPGRYFYVAWGETKGGVGSEFGQSVANYATKAQMNVQVSTMPGTAHAFPDFEKLKVKEWLDNVVVPARLARP